MPTIIELYNKNTKLQDLIRDITSRRNVAFTTSVEEFKRTQAGMNANEKFVKILLTELKDGTSGVLFFWMGSGVVWISASPKIKYPSEIEELRGLLGISMIDFSNASANPDMTSAMKNIGLNAGNDKSFSADFAIKYLENFWPVFETTYKTGTSWNEIFNQSVKNSTPIKAEEIRQSNKDIEDIKKKVETLEQEKKTAKDEVEALKGKLAESKKVEVELTTANTTISDKDFTIKGLTKQLADLTKEDSDKIANLRNEVKNKDEELTRRNEEIKNLTTKTLNDEEIKRLLLEIKEKAESNNEGIKNVPESIKRQMTFQFNTSEEHLRTLAEQMNNIKLPEINLLPITTKLDEIAKKVGEIDIPEYDFSELTKQIGEVGDEVKAIRNIDVEDLKTILTNITPDFTKTYAKLDEIIKKITEIKIPEPDLSELKTKFDEMKTKLNTPTTSSTPNYEEKFNEIRTFIEEAEQKITDLHPLFEKFVELKAMVQQLIDAQPQEAQEGN